MLKTIYNIHQKFKVDCFARSPLPMTFAAPFASFSEHSEAILPETLSGFNYDLETRFFINANQALKSLRRLEKPDFNP
jgi:hypothetical protein